MPESLPSPAVRDFFAIAGELGFLDAPQVSALRDECRSSGLVPPQFAAEKGCLSGVDIDIIETLAAPDDVVPGYRLLGLIGKGGMGVVYRAEQRNLGRVVALKTILVSRMSDRAMLDRFELEARTIGQLRHPNIVAAHDFGRHAGRLYLAMELVEGTDLDRHIKEQGPLDEWLAWGLARQTAAGLAHAMQQRVVHRDIKPANLMLVTPPEGYPLPSGMPMVKIADFGLALLQEDLDEHTRLTAADATVGSPHYMAPEQLESSDVDYRADMYALGATLYHALTGHPPCYGMKLSQIIATKLGEGPPPLTSVRQDLQPATCRLVARLMARDPADRPASYTDLLAEIDAATLSLETAAFPAHGKQPWESTEIVRSPPATPLPSTATDPQHSLQTLGGGQLAQAAGRTGRRASLLRLTGIAATVTGGLVAALWWSGWWGESSVAPIRPVIVRVLPGIPLFNGVDTRGWIPGRGNWVYHPEDASLTGTNGFIQRPIPPDPSAADATGQRPQPLRWYRLELLLLALTEAGPPVADAETAQELHFGLESLPGNNDPPRYVLRRSKDQLELGYRLSRLGPFLSQDHVPVMQIASDAHVAITLERLSTGWFVDVNGEPFCIVPLRPQEQPVFGFQADGEVRFAEVSIYPVQLAEGD